MLCRVGLSLWILLQATESSYIPSFYTVGEGCGESATVQCPTCTATVRSCKDRERKSWSTLSDPEKLKFIDATKVMKSTSTSDGQALYGSDYYSYDHFIQLHAVWDPDPRGDQGHLGVHFIVVHTLFVLMFEKAILAVDSSIGALPYWDFREGLDVVMGSSNLSFGSVPGTGEHNEVIDGAFSDWTVSDVDEDLLAAKGLSDFFDGFFLNVSGTRILRQTPVPTRNIVRYDTCSDATETLGPEHYTSEDYVECVSQSSFTEHYWCLENFAVGCHEPFHFYIGSGNMSVGGTPNVGWLCENFSPPVVAANLAGDLFDKGTSPNDPIFFLLHNFVVMAFTDFLSRQNATKDLYYGYPANSGSNPSGTNLMDVVSDKWPFDSKLLDDAEQTGNVSFWEALCWLRPDTAAYTFDAYGDTLCTESDDAYDLKSIIPALVSAFVVVAFIY